MLAVELLGLDQLRHSKVPSGQAQRVFDAILAPQLANLVQIHQRVVERFDQNVDGHPVPEGGGEVVDKHVRTTRGGLQTPSTGTRKLVKSRDRIGISTIFCDRPRFSEIAGPKS